MPHKSEIGLRRVVLTLDAAQETAGAIEIAADVARGLEIALHAVLVEDEDLERLAALPFPHYVDLATAERKPLDLGIMRHEIERCAAEARRLLGAIAGRSHLAWSVEVRQTAISRALAAMKGDELIALNMTARPAAGPAPMQLRWRGLVMHLDQPMLLIPDRPPAGGMIAAVHDASPIGERVLETSLHLARSLGRPLSILMQGRGAGDRQTRLEKRLREENSGTVLRVVAGVSPLHLRSFVHSTGTGLLIVSRDQLSDGAETESMLGNPPSPLLVL